MMSPRASEHASSGETAMLRSRVLPFVLVLVLVVAAPVLAADDAAEKVAKQEAKVREQCADDLIGLSRFCAKAKAIDAARDQLERGLAVAPESKKLKDEQKKLEGKTGEPAPGFAEAFAKERAKVDERCALRLADLAVLAQKEKQDDAFERAVSVIRDSFPVDKALARTGVAWFEPYLKWVKRAEADKLAAGGEEVDGSWLDKGAVAELDRKHASWQDPWVISDEVHEVRTTMSLRTARTILAQVAAFRAFFLKQFQPAWDLQPPKGKLPVIVTATQVELKERMKEECANLGGAVPQQSPQGAAYYLLTNGALNPCFVTFEPMFAGGQVLKVELDQVELTLRHEICHQIAFEYCKHDSDRSRMPEHQFWCVEGLANFLMYYSLEKGRWTLKKPRTLRMGSGMIESPFAWCSAHADAIPPLETFMATTRDRFATVENYHIASVVAWFLLDGEGGKHHASFVKLLERVHKAHDDEKVFDACFEPDEKRALQAQFSKFVARIRLDS
jgi:hypothetical protein